MQLQDDRLTEFFGGKPHRARALQRHTPPPYSCKGDFEKPPTAGPYPSADDEPITLARYLFVYGFCTSVVSHLSQDMDLTSV
jgi:hypothetical protein